MFLKQESTAPIVLSVAAVLAFIISLNIKPREGKKMIEGSAG
jgi:hypothetical protein